MSLQGVARGNGADGPSAHQRDDWVTGRSGGCSYRECLLIAISAQPVPIITHSSNGLHDTRKRALGPDLGHNAAQARSCLSQTPLSPAAPAILPPVPSLSR
jgi:hypothetical protein